MDHRNIIIKLLNDLKYDKCWLKSKKRYKNFIKKINKHLSEVRKKFKKYYIRLTINHKNKCAFYSGNLDFLKENEIRYVLNTNSLENYIKNTLYDKSNIIDNNNSINIKFGNNIHIYTLIEKSDEIFNKGFYLWTYGIYGEKKVNEIPETQNTKGTYELNIQSSEISWYPEPPIVINTYANIPSDCTMTIAFSGLVNPGTINDTINNNTILGQSNGIYNLMIGIKCICLGGGTILYTSDIIEAQQKAIENNQFIKYDILCFDIEGFDSTVTPELFNNLFKIIFDLNYTIIITTSHSAPYAAYSLDAANKMMQSFFNSLYIKCISTQMYSIDLGVNNEYAANAAVSWDQFNIMYNNRLNQNLIITPSLLSNNQNYGMYNLNLNGGTNENLVPIDVSQDILIKYPIDTGCINFFKSYNIETIGSIQWMNGYLTKLEE